MKTPVMTFIVEREYATRAFERKVFNGAPEER
jgi:hypothetical protein